ncbi:MAG: cytochrome c maturation protein CcmE [Candidatus Pacebacteria bacterium]|nr:cytochrome c maturation protein CcmE [Candidatus Paceibacterota bacterium]
MKRKHRRLVLVLAILAAVMVSTALVLLAFRDSLVFFYGPTEAMAQQIPEGRRFRLGGLVEQGSVLRDSDGLGIRFRITDLNQQVAVNYRGSLPDLFREGQGVVAEGSWTAANLFTATTILAKHDENYMPKEVAESLKNSGKWRGAETGKAE